MARLCHVVRHQCAVRGGAAAPGSRSVGGQHSWRRLNSNCSSMRSTILEHASREGGDDGCVANGRVASGCILARCATCGGNTCSTTTGGRHFDPRRTFVISRDDGGRSNRRGSGCVSPAEIPVAERSTIAADECRGLMDSAVPAYVPVVRNGGTMHVRMLCLGRHWNGKLCR